MSGAWDAENIPAGAVYAEPPFRPAMPGPVPFARVDCLCGGRFRMDRRKPLRFYAAHRRTTAHRRLTEEYRAWLG